jgi:hypothetical protein
MEMRHKELLIRSPPRVQALAKRASLVLQGVKTCEITFTYEMKVRASQNFIILMQVHLYDFALFAQTNCDLWKNSSLLYTSEQLLSD